MYRLDYAADLMDATGPLGFRMRSQAASELETILKSEGVQAADYRRYVVDEEPQSVSTAKRSDVSWISVESPDKEREVILSSGMNFSVIRRNNIVTIDHKLPVVAKSLWQKVCERADGGTGVMAKTEYLPKPDGWDAEDKWIGDAIFNLVVQKALPGKSVGILPVPGKVRAPSQQEVDANPSWEGCKVYEKSYLVEYAICPRPVHPDALTVTVQKSFPGDADLLAFFGLKEKAEPPPQELEYKLKSFVPVHALEMVVKAEMERTRPDLQRVGSELAAQALYRATGKITR